MDIQKMPDLYACAIYVLDHMNKADGGIANLHKTILLKSYKRTLARFMAKKLSLRREHAQDDRDVPARGHSELQLV